MKFESLLGKAVGVGLLAGATLAVWFWPKAERPAAEPPVVRPVKSVVVTDGAPSPDLHFAARVKAANSRTLSFRQSGRIQGIAVESGAHVRKGDRLAWLDPTEYKARLAIAEANAAQSRLTYERKAAALKLKGVSQNEVSQAEAAMKGAEAALATAKRDFAETVLYAPFDGVVAQKFADELDVVDVASGLKRVLTVQDTETCKIDAALPETMVIRYRNLVFRDVPDENLVFATFDAYPKRRFPVKFVECQSTSEESRSRTFTATYLMKKPGDLLLLPGMSATITVPGSGYRMREESDAGRFELPESAVGAASDGGSFVWVLERTETDGVWCARRRAVQLDVDGGRALRVRGGLKAGERVATSGVTILSEGRRVSLMKETAGK